MDVSRCEPLENNILDLRINTELDTWLFEKTQGRTRDLNQSRKNDKGKETTVLQKRVATLLLVKSYENVKVFLTLSHFYYWKLSVYLRALSLLTTGQNVLKLPHDPETTHLNVLMTV